MSLWIEENYVNATKGYRFGDSGEYETAFDKVGDLFRSLRKKYGRPSKMYVDRKDGSTIQTGWVFTGKAKYEDTGEEYSREVWVTVYKAKPVREVTVKVEYAFEGAL